MNYNAEILKVKELLARYYDGATTADEERRLSSLLSEIGCDNLPDDLKSDWMLFSGLDAMERVDSQIEVPAELISRMDKFAVSEVPDTKTKARIRPMVRRFIAFTAAAAVLAGAIVTTVLLWHAPEMPIKAPSEAVALNSPADADQMGSGIENEVGDSYTDVCEISGENIKQEIVAVSQHTTPTTRQTIGNQQSYRTVTDIDEAIAITRQCTALLSLGGSESSRVIEDIDTQLDKVYQTIIKI